MHTAAHTALHAHTHNCTTDTALHVDTAVHRDMSIYMASSADTQLQRPTTALYVDRETHSFPLEHTPTHRQLYIHSLYGQALSDGSKQPGSHPCSTTALKTLRTAAHAESHHHPHRQPRPGPLPPDPPVHKTQHVCACATAGTQALAVGLSPAAGQTAGQHLSRDTKAPSAAGKGGEGHAPCPAWPALLKPGGDPGLLQWRSSCQGELGTGGARGLQVPHPPRPRAAGTFPLSQVGGAPAHPGLSAQDSPRGNKHTAQIQVKPRKSFFLFRVPEAHVNLNKKM